jgi:hypothetical protein
MEHANGSHQGAHADLLARYEEECRTLTEQTERERRAVAPWLAPLLSLARQHIERWGLEIARLEETLAGLKALEKSLELTLFLDVDTRTDELLIRGVRISCECGEDSLHERLVQWTAAGVLTYWRDTDVAHDERQMPTPRGTVVLPFFATQQELQCAEQASCAYALPHFPKLLADRRSCLSRLARDGYGADHWGMSVRPVPLITSRAPDEHHARPWTQSLDALLLESWLRLHDAEYLCRAYDLEPIPALPLPRLLLDDESFVRQTARISCGAALELCLQIYAPDALDAEVQVTIDRPLPAQQRSRYERKTSRGPRDVFQPKKGTTKMPVPRLSEIGIGLNCDGHTLEAAHLGRADGPSDGRKLIGTYEALKQSGLVVFVARRCYASHAEASAALLRLRRLSTVPADAARTARPGAVSATLASVLPRSGHFAAPALPASYTRGEAEERWRGWSSANEQQPFEPLLEIAAGLGLRTQLLTSFERLQRAVRTQLEAEFGERARLREAAELHQHERRERVGLARHDRAPTSDEVDRLLADAHPTHTTRTHASHAPTTSQASPES